MCISVCKWEANESCWLMHLVVILSLTRYHVCDESRKEWRKHIKEDRKIRLKMCPKKERKAKTDT